MTAGADLAEYAFLFGAPPNPTYEQFVALVLNAERIRARNTVDLVRALRIADGTETMPFEWIESLTTSPEEARRWRSTELKLGLRRSRKG
jgi:hypothetical protein